MKTKVIYILVLIILATGCKRYCWKCDIPHAVTRYIDMYGKVVDIETYTEKQRLEVYSRRIYYMHSTYDTTLLMDSITREYCGSKQEMEEEIRVNNIINEQICYQEIQ